MQRSDVVKACYNILVKGTYMLTMRPEYVKYLEFLGLDYFAI